MTLTAVRPEEFPAQDNLFQTAFWGRFKTTQSQQALYFLCEFTAEEHTVRFPLMVLLRKTKTQSSYAYVPKGPSLSPTLHGPAVLSEDQWGSLLEQVSLAVQPHLPPSCICIRYDLPWLSPYFHHHETMPRTEIMELRINYATSTGKLRKAPMNHFSPDTVLINLTLPPEKILARMRQTTRNSVRRAYKEANNFTIYENMHTDEARAQLAAWHALYTQTAKRKKFFYEQLPYFEQLFQNDPPPPSIDGSLPLHAPAPDPSFYLFTAHLDGTLISGLILAICGTSAYYLYAASTPDQKSMPNYGLQWEAIRFARIKGCTVYDLLGIPPSGNIEHPMSGLYTFKTGLGGDRVRYFGCWDYPFLDDEYTWFRNTEGIGGLQG